MVAVCTNSANGTDCEPLAAAAGEVLLGDLSRAGFDITSDHEAADAIVVNTCAFVEDAKSESLEVRHTSSCSVVRAAAATHPQQCVA